MVYHEVGCYAIIMVRKFRIFKYCIKLRNIVNCILKSCYDDMILNNDQWIINVKQELYRIGLGFIWELPCVSLDVFQQRLCFIFKARLLNTSSKGFVYLVNDYSLNFYLRKLITFMYLKEIVKIRMSAHNLNIECG